MSAILPESRVDAALSTVPIQHRAALYAHYFGLLAKIRELEAQLSERVEVDYGNTVVEAVERAIADTEATTRQGIVEWLRASHPSDTVRATYARKLADRIEAREDVTGEASESVA